MLQIGIIALSLSIILMLTFGGIALTYASKMRKIADQDTDFFLTARNSQTAANIAWTFYSSTVGAWYDSFFNKIGYCLLQVLML